MEKAKMFVKAWACAAGIAFVFLLALHWPSTEEKLFWLPSNSEIKNPVEKGTFIPILEYRTGESLIEVSFKQYIELFEKNRHEVYIQSDGNVFYVTETGGLKFVAKKKYLERDWAKIHAEPIVLRINHPANLVGSWGFSAAEFTLNFLLAAVFCLFFGIVACEIKFEKKRSVK